MENNKDVVKRYVVLWGQTVDVIFVVVNTERCKQKRKQNGNIWLFLGGGGRCMVGDLRKKQQRSYSGLQSPLLGEKLILFGIKHNESLQQ